MNENMRAAVNPTCYVTFRQDFELMRSEILQKISSPNQEEQSAAFEMQLYSLLFLSEY